MHTFSQQQINDTLKIVESTIVNCEKVQPKLKGSCIDYFNKK